MSAAVLDALPRRAPPDPRQMQRCLLLAALLHVWLVLMLGNATGSAAPGQGVWGSLTVKLMGRSGNDPGAAPSPSATAGSTAAQPTDAGAASTGRWNPREVPPDAARTDDPSAAEPSTATLTLPEGFQPVERERLDTPPPPRQSTADIAPLSAPAAINRLDARPDTPPTPLPSPADLRTPARTAEVPALPTELPAPVQRLEAAPTASVTPLPRPAELRMPSTPAPAVTPTADLPAPVRRLELPADTAVTALPRATDLRPSTPATAAAVPPSAELPAAVRRLEAPATERATATPLPRAADLRQTPSTPTAADTTATDLPAPVRRLEAPTAERGAASSSLPRASDLRQAPSSPATAAATATDLPATVRRLEVADNASSVTPLQPATGTRPAQPSAATQSLPELSKALPGAVAGPTAGPAQGDPAADRFAAPKASAGSPDAGPRLGANVPAPPSTGASAPQAPLNLSLPRGDMTSRRGPGLIDLVPPPPERKSKLEQSIEDATNKDCRKAYANTGILAAVPLALDAARGKGCKW